MIHSDPALVARAEENSRRFPYQEHRGDGVPQPLVDGQPQLLRHITDEMLAAYASHPDDLAAMRAFAPKSMMLLPLVARQRPLGLMVLASAESQRIYGDDDLALAAELAARAVARRRQRASLRRRAAGARRGGDGAPAPASRASASSTPSSSTRRRSSPSSTATASWCWSIASTSGAVGKSAAEMLGHTIGELALIAPADAQALAANERRVIEERRPLQFESSYPDRGGQSTFF